MPLPKEMLRNEDEWAGQRPRENFVILNGFKHIFLVEIVTGISTEPLSIVALIFHLPK